MSENCDSQTRQVTAKTDELTKEVHWIQHATFWSQIALGVIGIAALWIYHGQLEEMRRATNANIRAVELTSDALDYNTSQFDRAQQLAITQSVASIKAANAAESASNTAIETLRKSQRPWVVAENVEPLEPFPNMRIYCRVGYKVDIRNTGVSVAKSVIFDSRAVKYPPTLDWVADRMQDLQKGTIKLWSGKRPRKLPMGIVLAPGQPIAPIRCPAFSDGNDPSDRQIASGSYLIIGYIQYADQFGLVHHTRFAFAPNADSVRPWDGKSYVIYNDYQDAD